MIALLRHHRGTFPSRVLAVLLLLIVFYAGWALVISPVRSVFQNLDAEITARRTLLGRYVAVANQEMTWKQSLRATAAELDGGEFLVDSPPAILAAELQSRITAVAQSSGLQVLSTRVLQVRSSALLKEAGIGVSLQGTQESLGQTLVTIEAMRPYLFVERLVINAQDQGTLSPQSPPALFVEADIYGVVRPASGEAGSVE